VADPDRTTIGPQRAGKERQQMAEKKTNLTEEQDANLDFSTVRQMAEAEVKKEVFEKAKRRLMDLYRRRDQAKKVVANVEREIKDLEAETEQELADLG
jgi:hypothetical protein